MIAIFRRHWLLLIILVLASFLRLYRIADYAEFLGDQGRDVVIVAKMIHTLRPTFIGPQTSIGNMYLGPWFYYLMIPSLLLANFNPVGPAVFIALMGVATVALLYYCTSNWFGKSAALIASFLYAVSPVVIKYSSFSWNPNIMPFFALLFIWSLSKIFFASRPRYLLLASLSFIFCLNSHYLALLLLGPLALYTLIFIFNHRRSLITLKPYFLSGLKASGLFLLSLVPLVLFDLKHHGQNVNAIIAFFTDRQQTVNLKAYKALPGFFPLLNQIITSLLAAHNTFWGQLVTLILVVALAIYMLDHFLRHRLSQPLVLIIIWLVVGVIGLALYKQHIYDHYFGFIYPSLFILTGVILAWLWQLHLVTKCLAVIAFAGLVYLATIQNPFNFAPNHQISSTKAVAQFVLTKAAGQPFNFALLAKQNYDPPYRYFIAQSQNELKLVSDQKTAQLFVVCEPSTGYDCNPIGNPFWDIAAFGQAKIANSWTIENRLVYKLVPNL